MNHIKLERFRQASLLENLFSLRGTGCGHNEGWHQPNFKRNTRLIKQNLRVNRILKEVTQRLLLGISVPTEFHSMWTAMQLWNLVDLSHNTTYLVFLCEIFYVLDSCLTAAQAGRRLRVASWSRFNQAWEIICYPSTLWLIPHARFKLAG